MTLNIKTKSGKHVLQRLKHLLLLCLSIWPFFSAGNELAYPNLNSKEDVRPAQKNEVDSIIAKSNAKSVLSRLKFHFEQQELFPKNSEYNKKVRLKSLNALTDYFIRNKQLDSATTINQLALKIELGENQELMVENYNNTATIYYDKSYYNEGMKWSIIALELAQKIQDIDGEILALNDAGITNWRFGNNDKAKEYLERSWAMSQENPVNYQAVILSNLGLVYLEEEKYLKAREMFNISLEKYFNDGNEGQIGLTYNNLGIAAERLEKYTEAVQHLEMAYKSCFDSKDDKNMVLALTNLSRVKRKQKRYKESQVHLDEALEVLDAIQHANGYTDVYRELYRLNLEKGNLELALANMRLFYQWRDSVDAKNNANKIKELQFKHETAERENQILKLSEVTLTQQRDLAEKDKTIKTFLLGGLATILLFISVSFFLHRKSELKKQKMIFNAIAKTEIDEQHRIARDLHDSIGTMLASLKNHLSLVDAKDEKSESVVEKAKKMLTRSIEETRRISHNMMPEELIKFGLVSAIESLLDNVRVSTKMQVSFEHNDFAENVDKSKELHIYRIVQELVQNTLKHSKSDFLRVTLKCDEKLISLNVEDRGTGFEYMKDKAMGYGLKNIQSRVDFLKGKLDIISEKDKGSTFNLNIPVS
nr:tetratricopeptide repeat protein [Allomuricauda sp.]